MFRNIPEVTKNLLILNVIVFLATSFNPSLLGKLGMYYPASAHFQPYQIITHMFTHANFAHILFNMLALFSFGSVLERVWGPKRFAFFYFFTGLGAMLLHMIVNAIGVYQITGSIFFDQAQMALSQKLQYYNEIPIVGASGALFGIFIGFGVLFPNAQIMLLIPPIPMKAKYMMPFMVAIELFLGFGNFSWDPIAHFAHLGGALFGYILIKIWNKDRTRFY